MPASRIFRIESMPNLPGMKYGDTTITSERASPSSGTKPLITVSGAGP
jgi:hypothetical protein